MTEGNKGGNETVGAPEHPYIELETTPYKTKMKVKLNQLRENIDYSEAGKEQPCSELKQWREPRNKG